ncbi:MAG: hypothetical protein WDO69_30640 [Pseudomonadota bacterium]
MLRRRLGLRLDALGCKFALEDIELLGADASVPLAVGTPVANPGPRGACVALDVEVQTPTVADLVISTTASFDAGDFNLNFR